MPADRREENSNRGLLTEFGLTDQAEQVWRALLADPNASLAEIGDATSAEAPEITKALKELAEAGLARSESSPSGFGIHEPTIAIETLIARDERELASRRERLGAIRATVPDLAEIYVRARAATQQSVDVDVVHAFDEIQERIFLAGERTRIQHRHFMRGVRTETVRGAASADAESLSRGVRQRSLIGTSDLVDPEVFAALQVLHDLGEEIRVVDSVPTQLMIMDRELAVVPRAADDQAQGAIFIREQALVDLLICLFDQMWLVAVPVFDDSNSPGAPSGRVARVLALVATGVKDDRIARTLGIATRTVRRDIADLRDELGVSTRTEIVAAAVRRGWL
ncbi:MAG TPA: LuxR C-terminal-related transcriptional regulator [Mycobacteriales bacterium]|nr:LuxR C-terminal-related transcriptional regulator [Mycobacteriales bacterium]